MKMYRATYLVDTTSGTPWAMSRTIHAETFLQAVREAATMMGSGEIIRIVQEEEYDEESD